MSEEKEYIPKSAMTIQAHPDDQDFSVGGTLAKWSNAGCEIISVVITSGDLGSNDPTKDGSYKPSWPSSVRKNSALQIKFWA